MKPKLLIIILILSIFKAAFALEPSKTSPLSHFHKEFNRPEFLNAGDQNQCTHLKGIWVKEGDYARKAACSFGSSDSGKPCKSSAECEGMCLPKKGDSGKLPGTCSRTLRNFCNTLENGVVAFDPACASL